MVSVPRLGSNHNITIISLNADPGMCSWIGCIYMSSLLSAFSFKLISIAFFIILVPRIGRENSNLVFWTRRVNKLEPWCIVATITKPANLHSIDRLQIPWSTAPTICSSIDDTFMATSMVPTTWTWRFSGEKLIGQLPNSSQNYWTSRELSNNILWALISFWKTWKCVT